MLLVLTASLQPQWFDAAFWQQAQPAADTKLKQASRQQHQPVQQSGHQSLQQRHAVQPESKPERQQLHHQPADRQSARQSARQTGKTPSHAQHRLKPLRPAASTAVPGNGFYVQVGAFQQRSSAQRLLTQLIHKGWTVVLARTRGGLHAVWIGPKRTRAEAEQLLKNIHQQLKYKGFIVHQKLA